MARVIENREVWEVHEPGALQTTVDAQPEIPRPKMRTPVEVVAGDSARWLHHFRSV